MSSKSSCLNDLFSFFSNNDIDYCVVGNSNFLPEIISSDIDIVVSGDQLKNIKNKLINFSKEHSCDLVQIFQHEYSAFYFIFSIYSNENKIEYIHPDICGDYFRRGVPLLLASELMSGKKHAISNDGVGKKFYVPAPEMEFIYYLIKKIDKGLISQDQYEHLVGQYNLAPDKCYEWMFKFWRPATIEKITDWIQKGKASRIEAVLPQLQNELMEKNRPSVRDRLLEVKRKIRRVLQPSGLIISILGPDGAGKTTVGDRLQVELAPAFRGVSRFHLRPYLLGSGGNGNDAPVIDPHGQVNRASIASIVKLFYFWLDYTLGYWLKLWPLKARSNLIVFDRYYHDLLVDPKRYRYGAPMWVARLIGYLIPKPDLFIVLDAPPEIIQDRKQEVTLAETRRQREAYLDFARKNSNCIVLNTNQALDQVVCEGALAVLDYLKKRQEKRIS